MAAPVADNSLTLEPNQSKKRRFAHLSEGERNVKKKNVIPGNTQRANNNAAKTRKAYLAEIGENQAFEKFWSLFIFITYATVEGAIMRSFPYQLFWSMIQLISRNQRAVSPSAAPWVNQPSDCEI